jgi:alkylhydroperoxidase/carboxymuconolactone decarboxylase family protein YurZ
VIRSRSYASRRSEEKRVQAIAEEGFRRLAIGDQRLLASACGLDGTPADLPHLDARTEALLRIASLVALDASPSSFRAEVDGALRAGARLADLVAVLVAVAGIVGSARVVSAAPRIALAAGYDVDAALEEIEVGFP